MSRTWKGLRATLHGTAIAIALGALACGDAGTDSARPETAVEKSGGASGSSVARPAATGTAEGDSPERHPDADFSSCPDGGEPRELAVPATATRLRWCERKAAGGARIQHGPYEKTQGGVVIERGGFRDGARDGRWTLYWKGGEPQSGGEYHNGRRAGIWSSWREDGTLINRHDYGDPASEVIEVASPETPTEGGAEVTLEIDNTRATPLVFRIDPFTQAWAIPPGGRFEVRSRGGASPRIRVEADEQGITVWPDPAAETTLLADGVELEP